MSIETTNVEAFVRETWEARNAGTLRGDEYDLARGLHTAIALDLHYHPNLKYNPERDVRVMWTRDIIMGRQAHPSRTPYASDNLEAIMRWKMTGTVMDPCGKDKAAGEH